MHGGNAVCVTHQKAPACHPMKGKRDAPNTSYDPGLLRQLDFGFRDWMGDGLKQRFALPDPRAFIPIMRCLAYDHLWDGRGTNNPVSWDVITTKNLQEIGGLVVEVLHRLAALAGRINGLAASWGPSETQS